MDRSRLNLVSAGAIMAGWLCAACPPGPQDPPPPEERFGVASAAPKALGALAGGTDAAPPAVFTPRRQPADEIEIPFPELDLDGGVESMDAGMQEGDDLPL